MSAYHKSLDDVLRTERSATTWIMAYEHVFSALLDAERELIGVREEASRLRHENEFMLQLIERRDQKEGNENL